jgi:hypothetical protein
VINRKSEPSVKFLNNLFKIKNIYAPSLDYGKRHESVAKGKYLELYHHIQYWTLEEMAF